MKNNIKLLAVGILGVASMFSCSSPSAEENAKSDLEDSSIIEEVVEEEEVAEPVQEIDLAWAGDLKEWITSGEGMKSITLDKISGEGEITEEGIAQLDLVAAILESNPTLKGEIQGHSVNKGKPAQEKIGSAARAEWTRLKLIFGHDAVAKNVSAKGYGSEKPIEGVDPADESQKRVTIEFSK